MFLLTLQQQTPFLEGFFSLLVEKKNVAIDSSFVHDSTAGGKAVFFLVCWKRKWLTRSVDHFRGGKNEDTKPSPKVQRTCFSSFCKGRKKKQKKKKEEACSRSSFWLVTGKKLVSRGIRTRWREIEVRLSLAKRSRRVSFFTKIFTHVRCVYIFRQVVVGVVTADNMPECVMKSRAVA